MTRFAAALLSLTLFTSAARATVAYRVRLDDRARHRAEVQLTVAGAARGIDLWMPVWTPGAYELRTWGRNVTPLDARDDKGQPLAFTRTGPSTFHVAGASGDVSVTYRVFAAHVSDDASWLDDAHALLNGSSLFLAVRGHEKERHEVRVLLPAGWRLASALDEAGNVRFARGYEELIDAPIECGRFAQTSFSAAGRTYDLVLDGGKLPERLPRDLARIADAEAKMVGAPPYRHYVVIVHLTDAPGRVAALEHAASTSILMPTVTLSDREGYDELTYVVAHELFHAWNARRLRPAELVPYDLLHAQPSRALWITEGLTEYYAHRAMLLSHRWTRAQWIEHTSDEIARAVEAARLGGSIEEAAELTWQSPDDSEGDPDSYYARGHLVGLAIDAAIRAASDGKRSLDDVMHALLDEATRAGGVLPVDSAALARACDRVAPGVGARLLTWVRDGSEPAKIAASLGELGLGIAVEPPPPRTIAGFVAEPDGPALRVVAVAPDGPAAIAGLRAGDRILAVDGAAPAPDFAAQIARRTPGSPLVVDAARGREHLALRIDLAAAPGLDCKLQLLPATPRVIRLRDAWLTP